MKCKEIYESCEIKILQVSSCLRLRVKWHVILSIGIRSSDNIGVEKLLIDLFILKDFFHLQIALTRSIFELEKFSFFSNRSEIRNNLIGIVISELHRQKRVLCRQN